MSEATPFGIYLHIPTARQNAATAIFIQSPVQGGVPQSGRAAAELAKNTHRPDTLYFGGGTPVLC